MQRGQRERGKMRGGRDAGTSVVCDAGPFSPSLSTHTSSKTIPAPEVALVKDITPKGGRKALPCFPKRERYLSPAGHTARSHTGSSRPNWEANPRLPKGSSSA